MSAPAAVPPPTPTKKRDEEFTQNFDLEEAIVEDFSCALQERLMLLQGRMYITENHVCFSSVFLKHGIKMLLRDITQISKRNTFIVFPNAIEIVTKDSVFLFTSLLFRDQTYKLLLDQREKSKNEPLPDLVAPESTSQPAASDEVPGGAPLPSQAPPPPGEASASVYPATSSSSRPPELVAGATAAASLVGPGDNTNAPVPVPVTKFQLAPPPPMEANCKHMFKEQKGNTVSVEAVFDVDPAEFWTIFFSDISTYYNRFYTFTKCTEYQAEPWSTREGTCCNTRKVSLRMPLGFPIGPKSTRVFQTQYCRMKSPDVLLYETSSVSADVPSSDAFVVNTYWEIVRHDTNPNACKVTITIKVVFLKWSLMKSVIESNSLDGTKKSFHSWIAFAKKEVETIKASMRNGIIVSDQEIPCPQPPTTDDSTLAPATEPTLSDLPGSSTLLPPDSTAAATPGITEPEQLSLPQTKNVLIGIAVLVVLTMLMFGVVTYLNYSLMQVESQMLQGWKKKNGALEERIIFLQDFVRELSQNITGSKGTTLDQEWKTWKSRKEFMTQLERWKQKVRNAKETLERTQLLLEAFDSDLASALSERRPGESIDPADDEATAHRDIAGRMTHTQAKKS